MCIFSGPVEIVAATKIFARGLADGRQVLAYQMDFAAAEPIAMVLPLPVAAGCTAIEFVDLSAYPDLFADLKKAFPQTFIAAHALGRGGDVESLEQVLEVHQVGAFEASFVPTASDFGRLDPRFRLPENVLGALPQYADWGFAVFQLRSTERTSVHPMALRFPRRDPDSVFFPTVHVHDGQVPKRAHFDHSFYTQLDPLTARVAGWIRSYAPLSKYVKPNELVDGESVGFTTSLMGELPNRDLILKKPPVTLDDLVGQGESYAYAIHSTYHYSLASHHAYPKWRETMATKLPQLCAGMRSGLAELCAANAKAWQLGPLHADLPPHFMNGNQLWRGTDYMNGARVPGTGPGRIAFRPFGKLVEQQDVVLAFSEMPSEEDANAINRALCQLLDRVVA